MLSELDVFSFLFAAACNDYGHDGLNNFYHMKKVTDRAIRFNDIAIQEQHTIAEVFSMLMQKENNFLAHLSRDNFKRFRKRFTGLILATDIQRTRKDSEMFEQLLESVNVRKGVRASELIDKTTPGTEFST